MRSINRKFRHTLTFLRAAARQWWIVREISSCPERNTIFSKTLSQYWNERGNDVVDSHSPHHRHNSFFLSVDLRLFAALKYNEAHRRDLCFLCQWKGFYLRFKRTFYSKFIQTLLEMMNHLFFFLSFLSLNCCLCLSVKPLLEMTIISDFLSLLFVLDDDIVIVIVRMFTSLCSFRVFKAMFYLNRRQKKPPQTSIVFFLSLRPRLLL